MGDLYWLFYLIALVVFGTAGGLVLLSGHQVLVKLCVAFTLSAVCLKSVYSCMIGFEKNVMRYRKTLNFLVRSKKTELYYEPTEELQKSSENSNNTMNNLIIFQGFKKHVIHKTSVRISDCFLINNKKLFDIDGFLSTSAREEFLKIQNIGDEFAPVLASRNTKMVAYVCVILAAIFLPTILGFFIELRGGVSSSLATSIMAFGILIVDIVRNLSIKIKLKRLLK